MHKQPFLSTGNAHIISAHLMHIFWEPVRNKHIHVVKLTALCLVNGRHHHISPRHVTKIFHRRLKHKLLEIREILHPVDFLKQLHATPHVRQAQTPFISRKRSTLRLLPEFIRNQRRTHLLAYILQEIPHLGHIPEQQALHRLNQLAAHTTLPQQRHQNDRLFIGLGKHTCGTLSSIP